jgi:hypothetical protein
MRKRFYWPNLHRDIETYIWQCEGCARQKIRRKTIAPMGSLPEAKEPGEVYSVDVTGPYVTSRGGNKYLLM